MPCSPLSYLTLSHWSHPRYQLGNTLSPSQNKYPEQNKEVTLRFILNALNFASEGESGPNTRPEDGARADLAELVAHAAQLPLGVGLQ